MTSRIILIIYVFSHVVTTAQYELINVYSSYSKVYGGTEDGGISGSERYVFLAKKNVILSHLKFENNEIALTKNDSLIVIIETYEPYTRTTSDGTNSNKIKSPSATKIEDCARVSKQSNTYYLFIPSTCSWNGKVDYKIKGKRFSAEKKSEFDTGYNGYAP